jgi:hypothetical protein
MKLGRPRARLDIIEKKKSIYSLPGFKLQIIQSIAWSQF